jgi:hypothetical protein
MMERKTRRRRRRSKKRRFQTDISRSAKKTIFQSRVWEGREKQIGGVSSNE